MSTTIEEHREQQALLSGLRESARPDVLANADKLQQLYRENEMAALSKDAYSSAMQTGQPPAGWLRASEHLDLLRQQSPELAKMSDRVLLEYLRPRESGFRAEIYLPDPAVLGPGYKPVIAFKGSANSVRMPDGSLRDTTNEDFLANNFPQAAGQKTDYYDRAMRLAFVMKNADLDFEITGHSLGGGMASAAAAVTGYHATTFNAAGLHPNTARRFTQESPGAQVFDVNKTVMSYQVTNELLNDSFQTPLHKMQQHIRDELAGVIRDFAKVAQSSPEAQHMLKQMLHDAHTPAYAQKSIDGFVDALASRNAEKLWSEVPMAAGEWRPLLDAKTRVDLNNQESKVIDRTDQATMQEMAMLAGPAFKVIQATAKGARVGEQIGDVAAYGSDVTAQALNRSGNVVRRSTEVAADVTTSVNQTAGHAMQTGMQAAGSAVAHTREAAGEIEARIDRAQGAVQQSTASYGADVLRSAGHWLPDSVEKRLEAQADRLEHAGNSAYQRNLNEAAEARRDARQDAVSIRTATRDTTQTLDTIVVRASDLQRDALMKTGDMADRGLDAAGSIARAQGEQARTVTTLAGGALAGSAAGAATLSPTDVTHYPDIAKTIALMSHAVPAGKEAFNRHLMNDTVVPSMEARVEQEETKARAILHNLPGPKKQNGHEAEPESATKSAHATRGPMLNESTHPDFPLYHKIHGLIERENEKRGIATDERSQCLAATFAVECKQMGVTDVHHFAVDKKKGTHGFVINTEDPSAGWAKYPRVDLAEGMSNSMPALTQKMADVNQTLALEAQQRALAPQHTPQPDGPNGPGIGPRTM